MPSILNQTNNNIQLLSTNGLSVKQLTPGVIEAVVLKASPLLNQNAYKLKLQHGTQRFEIISQQAINAGQSISLKVDSEQKLTLLSIDNKAVQRQKVPEVNIDTTTSRKISPPLSSEQASNHRVQKTTSSLPLAMTLTTAKHQIEQFIHRYTRQALPQQRNISDWLPLISALKNTDNAKLSPAITQQLEQLLAAIPTSRELSKPSSLKKTLLNSGNFLESTLKNLHQQQQHRQQLQSNLSPQQRELLPKQEYYQSREQLFTDKDIKAQILKLYQLIQPGISKPIIETTTQTRIDNDTQTLNLNPLANVNPATPQQPLTENLKPDNKAVDIILQQMSKQILASLAKTQLNQLETLSPKLQASAEPSGANWTIDIPIFHRDRYDNLNISISEQNSDKKDLQKKTWRVMLHFDLHDKGKFSAELAINDQLLAATLWAEKTETLNSVKEEVSALKKQLENIGVNVSEIQCLQGKPRTIKQQHTFIDLRT